MKKKQLKSIVKIHPRNKHKGRYNFEALVEANPALKAHIVPNRAGEDSIDFANPESVKTLNYSLLKLHYNIDFWEIPEGYLCPPIPGRADYIHHMADWLAAHNFGRIPTGEKITCLDIGVGSSLIYPIIGIMEYGWSFIGSDIDPVSLKSASNIAGKNHLIDGKVNFRAQPRSNDILFGILTQEERIDITVCNPPFHASAEDAHAGSSRKVSNLTGEKTIDPTLNFAGRPNELWCEGGERKFIHNYVRESKKFGDCCFWYSTLVSKQTNLKSIYAVLDEHAATKVHTIPMGQGNKSSRIVTWTFLSSTQQKEWKQSRWNDKKSASAAD